jgi:uncharacterized protein YlbG (UPF0298 family)
MLTYRNDGKALTGVIDSKYRRGSYQSTTPDEKLGGEYSNDRNNYFTIGNSNTNGLFDADKVVEGFKVLQLVDNWINVHSTGTRVGRFLFIPVGKKIEIEDLEYQKFDNSVQALFDKQIFYQTRMSDKKLNSKHFISNIELSDDIEELFDFFNKNSKTKKKNQEDDSFQKDYKILIIPTLIDAIYFLRSSYITILSIDHEVKFKFSDWISPLKFLAQLNETSFPTVAKYVTAYPLAKYLDNDLPKVPVEMEGKNPLLFSGMLRSWLKKYLCKQTSSKGNKVALTLWNSYLQSIKRACKPLSQAFIKSAYIKHSKAMANKRDYTSSFMYKFQKESEKFCSTFEHNKPKIHQPSTSASYESGMADGGAYSWIISNTFPDTTILQPLEKVFRLPDGTIQRIKTFGNFSDDYEIIREKIKQDSQYRHLYVTEEELKKTADKLPVREFIEVEHVNSLFYNLEIDEFDGKTIRRVLLENTSDNLIDLNFGERYKLKNRTHHPDFYWDSSKALVMTYAISEPLKIRMITKGESFKYFFAKDFQKQMWNHMTKFPQLNLTNREITNLDLESMMNRLKTVEGRIGMGFGFNKMVSGDYSAATDNLKSCYTMSAFECFLEKYGSWRSKNTMKDLKDDAFDKDILRSVLYNSTVEYPKWTGIDPVVQKNGQLMGSPLSFPILCMVNLIAYKMAMEEYLFEKTDVPYKLSFYELPVLVNGDDILFPSNDELYIIWKRCIEEVGFELSLGKNYIHKNVCVINSQLYLYNWETNKFELIQYVNNGLLVGQSKLSIRRADEVLPLSEWYNRVMVGTRPDNRRFFHNRFLYYHKERVSRATNHGEFSLFIDPLLGGCGFKKYDEIENYYTGFQKKLALFLYKKLTTFEGSINDLKKLIFRPLLSDPLMKLDFIEDIRIYKTFLIDKPKELAEELILKEFDLNQRVKTPDFGYLDQSYQGVQETPPLYYKSSSRLLKEFKKFWKQAHINYTPLTDKELEGAYILCYNNNTNLVRDADNNAEFTKKYDSYDVLDVTGEWDRYKNISETAKDFMINQDLDFDELFLREILSSTDKVNKHVFEGYDLITIDRRTDTSSLFYKQKNLDLTYIIDNKLIDKKIKKLKLKSGQQGFAAREAHRSRLGLLDD